MSRPRLAAAPVSDRRRDAVALLELPWRDPVGAAAPFAEEAFALCLLSAGNGWSYLLRNPAETLVRAGEGEDPLQALQSLLGPPAPASADGPPFQGGVAGLLSYDLGRRIEPTAGAHAGDWPELACGIYDALLAFDHDQRRVVAVGRGAGPDEASARAAAAAAWLDCAGDTPVHAAAVLTPEGERQRYEEAVADVVARIRAGELFQANIARTWRARLPAGATPFGLFATLAERSPAPFAGYLRLPGRAVVSNSPERFLGVDADGVVVTRPIKGTRARGPTPAADAALAEELAGSAKDRAENLMIVDLVRNDLARACRPGSVEAVELFAVESYANVHHLVSTVRGRLAPGTGVGDLLRATFPPGSVTGAPKVQAMRVIARLEPPRGPYCGSLFWAGFDGAFDSSVLIRTLACTEQTDGWVLEARAGAGITAESEPAAEAAEADAKIQAVRRAIEGDA